ncbi:MAG: hypothetical protein J6S19_08630 [Lentisphaeria bacterium]|nr:hypothetical protein [Lentisphaeria bacterium]
MNNRVDYLSDKLVNLRGKLKSVNEVVPPESIANGVSIARPVNGSSAESSDTTPAAERRSEQLGQLCSDCLQRLARRQKQLEVYSSDLERDLQQIKNLQQELEERKKALAALQNIENGTLSAAAAGDRIRSAERERLSFFAADGAIEMLINKYKQLRQEPAELPAEESFGTLLKKGWALALSLGLVVGFFALAAALIIFLGWR